MTYTVGCRVCKKEVENYYHFFDDNFCSEECMNKRYPDHKSKIVHELCNCGWCHTCYSGNHMFDRIIKFIVTDDNDGEC